MSRLSQNHSRIPIMWPGRAVHNSTSPIGKVSSGVGTLKLLSCMAQSYNTYNMEKLLSAEVEVRTRSFVISCSVDFNTNHNMATPSALVTKLNCSFLSTLHWLAQRYPIQKGSFPSALPIHPRTPSYKPGGRTSEQRCS